MKTAKIFPRHVIEEKRNKRRTNEITAKVVKEGFEAFREWEKSKAGKEAIARALLGLPYNKKRDARSYFTWMEEDE